MSEFPQPPSIFPAALSTYEQTIMPFRGRPQAPRNVRATAGSLETLITWNAPANMEGVEGWRVYKDNERNIVSDTLDRNARQYRAKLPGGQAKALFLVAAVSELGREGPLVAVLAQSDTNKLVLTGTTGETGGAASTAPPGWEEEPTGGFRRFEIL